MHLPQIDSISLSCDAGTLECELLSLVVHFVSEACPHGALPYSNGEKATLKQWVHTSIWPSFSNWVQSSINGIFHETDANAMPDFGQSVLFYPTIFGDFAVVSARSTTLQAEPWDCDFEPDDDTTPEVLPATIKFHGLSLVYPRKKRLHRRRYIKKQRMPRIDER